MAKNRLDMQNTLTMRTDLHTDSVLFCKKVIDIKKKPNSSHFLKFLLASPNCTHLALPDIQTNPLQNYKSANIPTQLIP